MAALRPDDDERGSSRLADGLVIVMAAAFFLVIAFGWHV